MSYESYHVKKKTDKNWIYCNSMTVMLVEILQANACMFFCV